VQVRLKAFELHRPRQWGIRANLRLGSLDNIVFAVVRGGGVSERQGWKAAAFARA
jgi:hypothetical protein